jgi:hypothetical protein
MAPRILRSVTVFAAAACGLFAQNPDDIDFRLELMKDPPQYAVDEPITFRVSLSSQTYQKYYASWTAFVPFVRPTILLEPKDDAVDLQANDGIIGGSVLGSSGILNPNPVTQTGDLTEWYRFEKPGHFRLSIKVDWVVRMKSREEGGGNQPVPLESNAVEFDILPLDPSAQDQELKSVLKDIDEGESDQAREAGLHRLDLLQTPAAAEEKARRYLAGARLGYNPYDAMLLRSSNDQQILPILERALTDPETDLPEGIVDLLVRLELRRESKQAPNSSAKDQAAVDAQKEEKVYARYSELLLKGLRMRSGSERLDAIFEAWSNAERRLSASAPASDALQQLRAELLSSSRELLPTQQLQFLTTEWDKIPHIELLPLAQRLASMRDAQGSQYWGFKFWCEDWPSECAKAVLAEVRDPGSKLNSDTILLIPEVEHSELDDFLRQRIEAVRSSQSGAERMLTTALVLRAGSKNIEPQVDALLDSSPGPRTCQGEGYLLGYLFRVNSAKGAKRLESSLRDKPSYCSWDLLRELAEAKNIGAAMPAMVRTLNSADLKTAEGAALFLSRYGPPEARVSISNRWEQLHIQWRDRAAELVSSYAYNEPQRDAAQLESALASALVRATAWKLTPGEQESLAAECLTDECRQMAEGKSWMEF